MVIVLAGSEAGESEEEDGSESEDGGALPGDGGVESGSDEEMAALLESSAALVGRPAPARGGGKRRRAAPAASEGDRCGSSCALPSETGADQLACYLASLQGACRPVCAGYLCSICLSFCGGGIRCAMPSGCQAWPTVNPKHRPSSFASSRSLVNTHLRSLIREGSASVLPPQLRR